MNLATDRAARSIRIVLRRAAALRIRAAAVRELSAPGRPRSPPVAPAMSQRQAKTYSVRTLLLAILLLLTCAGVVVHGKKRKKKKSKVFRFLFLFYRA